MLLRFDHQRAWENLIRRCVMVVTGRGTVEKHFQVHDLGDTSFLLGVHIQRERSKRTLTLSQHQYIVDLLQHYGMSDCVAVSTPLDPNCKLSKEQSPQDDKEKDRKSTRLNSSHSGESRMPSSA